jgi:hypothetical protein
LGTESARAPSVSTRLRFTSKVSVPVASARISTSPTQTVCASGFLESDHPAAHPCTARWTAVRLRVVDQQAGLEVLAVVGEVQAEQFGVTAGRVEAHGGRHPHHVAAQCYGHVAQHGVLTQPGVLCAHLHGVVGPVGHPTTVSRLASPTTNSTLSA